ncbi:MAG: phosphotransferase family protein [Ilumatobacteraceae bacterium]
MTRAASVPGVDLHLLEAWMDGRGLGSGALTGPDLIAGGTQNVLLRFSRSGRTYVLRRPPVHKRTNSDETMRREARVLAALSGSAVPHPALIAAEPDAEVLGAAFYLMEPVDGFNPTLGLPAAFASDRSWQLEMGLAMADAIAALAAVDHEAVGLADLGRFEGWAGRQVGRWRRQLDGYCELAGYPGPDIPGVDDVGEWLGANLPTEVQPGLMHGDFHFGNVLIAGDRPAVAAMVDWELVTIGDPLLDLGHLLATWPAQEGVTVSVDAPGLPTPDEVVARYASHTSRPLDDLLWFRVLACYRLGLILEGTHARACAGLAPKATGDLLHSHTVSLFRQALGLLG